MILVNKSFCLKNVEPPTIELSGKIVNFLLDEKTNPVPVKDIMDNRLSVAWGWEAPW